VLQSWRIKISCYLLNTAMSAKTIAFVETCNITPHLETSLELAKLHLERGDHVSYHFIGHKLPYNDFPKPPESIFGIKSSAERLGLRLIAHKRLKHPSADSFQVCRSFSLPELSDLETLKQFKYKSYNAGLACVSSLVTRLRKSNPRLGDHGDLVYRILLSGVSVYEYVLTLISSEKPDLLYLFNGRFANNRAIMEAAIEKNVPFLVHERGANKNRYITLPFMPHDWPKMRKRISQAWREGGSSDANREKAERFFHDRRAGMEQSWTPFTRHQTKGSGVLERGGNRKIVSYFFSSDDEFASIGDCISWKNWKSQRNAVKSLIRAVSELPSHFLVLRLHPHLLQKHPEDLRRWQDLQLPENAVILSPDSPVDTYALIEQSAAVVTCGSTTGIESVFWGTPSICLGPSLYEELGAVYLPSTEDELGHLLVDETLTALPDRALPYGFYMQTFGSKFRYYEPETLFAGRFLGVNLQEEHWIRKIKNTCCLAKRKLSRA